MDRSELPFVIRHRHILRVVLSAIAFGCALAIPRLQMRFAPEELVAPDEDGAAAGEEMERRFGAEPEILLALVEADDVLEPSVFSWTHRFALALGAQPEVERVESLGTTPLPHEADDDSLDLETLETRAAETFSREQLIARVVAADPARFPDGMASLAETGRAPLDIAPLVAGPVPSPAELDRLRRAVTENRLIQRRLISDDHRVMVVAAILEPSEDDQASAVVEWTQAHLAANPPPSGVRTRLAGLPVMRVQMVAALRRDQVALVVLATIGSLLVLIVGLRSWAGVLLPMASVGLTLAITMGTMALIGLPINLLTNVIPPLLLTIGLADGVHMVLRYREELANSFEDRHLAASRAFRGMWRPTLVTSLTTAIGFGALVVQSNPMLHRFGLLAASATMLSFLITVVFVPASLPSFPNEPATIHDLHPSWIDRVLERLARFTAARAWTILGSATAVFAAVIGLASQIVVDSKLLDQFDADSETAAVTELIETELDGFRTLSVGLNLSEATFYEPEEARHLDALATWLSAQPGVLRVTSYLDWVREARALLTGDSEDRRRALTSEEQIRAFLELVRSGPVDPIRAYLTESGTSARLEVKVADYGAREMLAMTDAFRERVSSIPGLEVQFGGDAWDASRGLDRIVRSLGSLSSAVVLIFLVMAWLFRSARFGLLAIPPNVLPLAITLAYMVWREIPLHAATMIVFTVAVGLAVDGVTHIIARFREERLLGLGQAETIVRTMSGIGPGVILSSFSLLLGYAALLYSAFAPVRLFGELSAVAIGGALIAQFVVLPAMLAISVKETRATLQSLPPPPRRTRQPRTNE